jgi:predicted nucleic acid-binding protein
VEFLKKIEAGGIKVFTSPLVLEEVFFKLLLQSASNFIEALTVQKVKAFLLDGKNRKEIMEPVLLYSKYIDHLREFGLVVADLTGKDIHSALDLSADFSLITADAVHLAVMERLKIANLASGDADFKVVPSLTLWSPLPAE